MTTPAPSRRRLSVLLLWGGGVALVSGGAFAVAWIKLPEWKPEWVIEHSPWADPGVRALLAPQTRTMRHFDSPSDPVLRWGDGIGPVLLARYQQAADPATRYEILRLASTTADQLTTDDPRAAPYPRLSESAAWRLREDLLQLAAMAMASGEEQHIYTGIGIARLLRGHDLAPAVRRFVHGSPVRPAEKEIVVEYLRDAGDMEGLLDLLSRYEGDYYRHDIMKAVVACLRPDRSAVVPPPAYDPDASMRPWAVSGRRRGVPDAAVRQRIIALLDDSDDNIRSLAVEACGSGRFTEAMPKLAYLLHQDGFQHFQPEVIEAIGALATPDSGPLLRLLATSPSEPWRGNAVIALGAVGDPADFSLLVHLLQDDDDDISRKARIALSHLSLTPEQRRQVDAIWDAREDDPEPAPTSPASPAVPPAVP